MDPAEWEEKRKAYEKRIAGDVARSYEMWSEYHTGVPDDPGHRSEDERVLPILLQRAKGGQEGLEVQEAAEMAFEDFLSHCDEDAVTICHEAGFFDICPIPGQYNESAFHCLQVCLCVIFYVA